MVTFRFYVVSIVAFFLALAVGVLVGSVLDGRIADGLQDRLARVEASLDENVAVIDQKNAQIDEFERFAEAVAPFAVQGRLEETTTLVVAESGVDPAPVEDLVARLRDSGTRVEGIAWLEPRWDLGEAEDLEAAAALGDVDSDDPDLVRAALWDLVVAAGDPEAATSPTTTTTTSTPFGAAPGVPPAGTETTTTVAPTTTEAVPEPPLSELEPLSDLIDAGLVRFQRLDGGTERSGGRLVVVGVTGSTSELSEPGAAATAVVRVAADAGLAAVLAEVQAEFDGAPQDPPPERGQLVDRAVSSGTVAFSTVDDLDLVAGRVAVVLALADLPDGDVGRFGYGPDVDGVLPPWPGP